MRHKESLQPSRTRRRTAAPQTRPFACETGMRRPWRFHPGRNVTGSARWLRTTISERHRANGWRSRAYPRDDVLPVSFQLNDPGALRWPLYLTPAGLSTPGASSSAREAVTMRSSDISVSARAAGAHRASSRSACFSVCSKEEAADEVRAASSARSASGR